MIIARGNLVAVGFVFAGGWIGERGWVQLFDVVRLQPPGLGVVLAQDIAALATATAFHMGFASCLSPGATLDIRAPVLEYHCQSVCH